MKLAILANAQQKEEWLAKPGKDCELAWVSSQRELINTNADAYFDLLFQQESGLQKYAELNAPVFINEVVYSFQSMNDAKAAFQIPILRLNAWATFLKRELIELSAYNNQSAGIAENIFNQLGWKFQLVPDIPGLITARVIAMIINEAYFTLEQEVSTKKEIDIAMKLGTNYPYGPFEWSEQIGLTNIYELLVEMSKADPRYQPAELLKKETEQRLTWH